MKEKIPFVLVGGGISGLAAARTLQDKGCDFALLESAPNVGGLTRSIQVDAYTFDYTGHLLHLSRWDTPQDLPYAGLANCDWQRVERKSVAFLDGNFVTAPVQYNLADLPPDVFDSLVTSYESRPPLSKDASFRDFMVAGFGSELSERFLIPQNEKTMAIALDRLSQNAVNRFFPAPDEQRVRAGMRPGHAGTDTYNSQFWYPKIGGIQRLVDGLARGVAPGRVQCLQEVVSIDLARRTIRTRAGQELLWRTLVSSMPLRRLCECTNDKRLQELGSRLTHSSTVSFNIGLSRGLGGKLSDYQWVYVPQRDIPFYRVGVYSHLSTGVCPPGADALYVEVGTTPDELESMDVQGDLLPRVIQSLQKLSWLNSSDIDCVVHHVMRCAYVHFTPEREEVLPLILERLHKSGVYPIGRYGLWDYTSMEDSIVSGIETAAALAS